MGLLRDQASRFWIEAGLWTLESGVKGSGIRITGFKFKDRSLGFKGNWLGLKV